MKTKTASTTENAATRTRLILLVVVPALLPLGAIAFYAWLPAAILKYFLFTKGFVAWTLTEYIMHRWAFHGNEDHGKGKQRDRFNHHHHHTHPSDMVIKLPVRIAAFAILALSMVALWFGNYFIIYIMGWLSGLAVYVIMHFMLHQSYAVKYFPNLVKQHIWHHCKYPHKCYGVTSTFWDRAFKTIPVEFKTVPDKIIRFYYKDENISDLQLNMIMKKLGNNSIEVNEAPTLIMTS